jgi:hypothetical protein
MSRRIVILSRAISKSQETDLKIPIKPPQSAEVVQVKPGSLRLGLKNS